MEISLVGSIEMPVIISLLWLVLELGMQRMGPLSDASLSNVTELDQWQVHISCIISLF